MFQLFVRLLWALRGENFLNSQSCIRCASFPWKLSVLWRGYSQLPGWTRCYHNDPQIFVIQAPDVKIWKCICLKKTKKNMQQERQVALTAPNRLLPFTMSTICRAMSSPQRTCASLVLAPRWGQLMTLGWLTSERFWGGSCSHTNTVRCGQQHVRYQYLTIKTTWIH